MLPIEEEKPDAVAELPEDVIQKVQRIERLAMPTVSPQERKRSFDQFEMGYSERDALKEAWRCLSCTAGATVNEDKCGACLTCLRVCPFGVPVVDNVAVMASEMCQACGLCAVECPAVAISIKRFVVGDIRNRIAELVSSSDKPVTRVEILCAQDLETREELRSRVVTDNGQVIARLPVTCAARADEVDMMKPFELGAETVLVRRCSRCRYLGADERLARRVARTRELLEAAGVSGDRLTLV